jgi:hypothetical protein|tara:strand:- start:711 stop:1073 length:363 start_codon:yes stop_codon:yes gene_type:complete
MTELHLNEPVTTTEAAGEVVDAYWETANPKPVAPYHKIRGIVRRCMDAEYRADEIVHALHNTDAFTLPAIEFALRSARKKGSVRSPAARPPFWKPEPENETRLPREDALNQIRMMRTHRD